MWNFIKTEPALVWTTSGTAIVAAIQNTASLQQDWKNWLTLGVILAVGFITRAGVTPVSKGA